MIASVKILAIFVCMVILIRKRVPIGYVLLIDAALAAALFKMSPIAGLKAAGAGAFSLDTLRLVGVMILIVSMGNTMRTVGSFDKTIASLEALLRDTRAVMAVIPAIIGLLPMPAGALMSAPLVGAVAVKTRTSPEQNTAINFWFRHVWEYVWPLYPGVIVTAALLKVPVRNLVVVNFPLTLAAIGAGLLFCLRNVPGQHVSGAGGAVAGHVKQLVLSLLPIIVVALATVIFSVPLPCSLGAVCAALLIVHRLNRDQVKAVIRRSITAETVFLIVGVQVFQSVIERSGAASQVVQGFVSIRTPPGFLCLVIPCVIGLLTGATLGFVGVTFPVLMPFFVGQPGDVAYGYVMLAYGSGFVGTLLSPVHLCLTMTRDYFKANFGQVYKLLIGPACVVIIAAILWFLFGVNPLVKRLGL